MQGFLDRVGSLDLLDMLEKEGMWDKVTDEVEYPEAITILARYFDYTLYTLYNTHFVNLRSGAI